MHKVSFSCFFADAVCVVCMCIQCTSCTLLVLLATPPIPILTPLSPLPFLPMMQYQECDQVIKEYKEMLEKARLKAEQEEKLRQMAIKVCMCVLQCKVQNWCSSQKRHEKTEEGWSGVVRCCNKGNLQCSYVCAVILVVNCCLGSRSAAVLRMVCCSCAVRCHQWSEQ